VSVPNSLRRLGRVRISGSCLHQNRRPSRYRWPTHVPLVLVSLALVNNLPTVVRPYVVVEGDQPGWRKVVYVTRSDRLKLERQLCHVIAAVPKPSRTAGEPPAAR
jgi:hypothetical protein